MTGNRTEWRWEVSGGREGLKLRRGGDERLPGDNGSEGVEEIDESGGDVTVEAKLWRK